MPDKDSRKPSERFSIVKSLGTAIGILGGLFALAKQGYEFWQDAHRSPEVALITGEDRLNVTYDPVAKTLQFAFSIGVINSGTASDVIRGGNATLDRPGAAPRPLMTSEHVTFYDTDQTSTPLRLPVILATDYQKTPHCVVSSDPGQQLAGSDDMSRLQLSITGITTAHTASLCFYLTDAAVAQLLETQHASFLAPKHCGEGQ